MPVEIPCGRCIGCRLDKARSWAARLMHETKLYKDNWFVTLTYDDEHVPRTPTGLLTLRPQDFTLFMKRLRKKHTGETIRYYQCGEYGEVTNRPHHHAILFNCKLPDLKPMNQTRARNAHTLYLSEELRQLWQHGNISVGQVTFESAAYVAAYVTKKITGPTAADHYKDRLHEYSTMSRRPGIAAGFYEKFATDIYPSDEIIVRGHPMRPPKYYDRILERRDPDTYYEVRDNRILQPRRNIRHQERNAREVTLAQKLTQRDVT